MRQRIDEIVSTRQRIERICDCAGVLNPTTGPGGRPGVLPAWRAVFGADPTRWAPPTTDLHPPPDPHFTVQMVLWSCLAQVAAAWRMGPQP